MPGALQSHKSFILRLVAAAVIVQVVFAVTDYYAYFAGGTAQTYALFQALFPLSVVVASLAAGYFLVFGSVLPLGLRLVATVMTQVVSVVYAFVLGIVFFMAQMLPLSWLNGPLWPNGGMLGMGLAATIALYLFPAIAFALASVTVMSVAPKYKPKGTKRKANSKLAKRMWLLGGISAGAILLLTGAYSVYQYNQLANFKPYIVVKMSPAQVAARRERIAAIYNSLNLPVTYKLVGQNIFGQERQYTWDKGRTMASSQSYVVNATPAATMAQLESLVSAAGFNTFVGEPYPNAIDKEEHFKDAQGEYIRLMVSSKPRDDAIRAAGPNGNISNLPDGTSEPSNVVIEVNLNDDNE